MMRGFAVFAAGILMAIAENPLAVRATGLENSSPIPIDAQSLCGTWQALPDSGGFRHLDAAAAKAMGAQHKNEGKNHDRTVVKYTINEAGSRTVAAVQTVLLDKTSSIHTGGKLRTNTFVSFDLVGVTRKDMVMFAPRGDNYTEIWTPLSPGVYDVAGFEAGSHPIAYYYVIKQTSKTACKVDDRKFVKM